MIISTQFKHSWKEAMFISKSDVFVWNTTISSHYGLIIPLKNSFVIVINYLKELSTCNVNKGCISGKSIQFVKRGQPAMNRGSVGIRHWLPRAPFIIYLVPSSDLPISASKATSAHSCAKLEQKAEIINYR